MTRVRTLCLLTGVLLLRCASPVAAASFAAYAPTLGGIPDGGPVCPSVGPARDVQIIVAGALGTVDTVGVALTLSHPFVGDLRATLIAPDGTSHVLFARTGALLPGSAGDASPLNGQYTFTDIASGNFWTSATGTAGAVPPGPYRTSAPGGTLAGGAPTLLATAFDDLSPNGTWIVRLEDGCAGNVGQVTGAVLVIDEQLFPTINGVGAGPLPDAVRCGVPGAAREMTFDFSNIVGAVHGLDVGVGLTHTAVGDLRVELIAPNGRAHVLVSRTGATGVTDSGDDTNLGGVYAFRDAGADWWGTTAALSSGQVLPSGAYRTALAGGPGSTGAATALEAPFIGMPVTGVWTVRVTDFCPGNTGTLDPSYLHVALQPSASVTAPQPPGLVRVGGIDGAQVTLQWRTPTNSPASTGYVVEGGVTPGQPLAVIPTGTTSPTLTFAAPAGSFHLRVRSLRDADTSVPSIEIPLHVGVPLVPSPPAPLLGSAVGTDVVLAWQPTFGGGAATGVELDVAGPVSGTVPLGTAEQFAVSNVPPGTYTFRLRGVNGAGSSAPTEPLTLAVPGTCTAPPLTPTGLVATRSGTTLQLAWDLPARGGAPSSYLLDVTSAIFTGQLPVTGRSLSAPVPSGTYTVRVASRNACGTSSFSGNQSVAVP